MRKKTRQRRTTRAKRRQGIVVAPTVRRGKLQVSVPISVLQLQHEVERIIENADINAIRHRFSPPPSAA